MRARVRSHDAWYHADCLVERPVSGAAVGDVGTAARGCRLGVALQAWTLDERVSNNLDKAAQRREEAGELDSVAEAVIAAHQHAALAQLLPPPDPLPGRSSTRSLRAS